MQHVSSLPIVAAFAILSWLLEPVVAASKANGSVVRTCYVGAVEEDWDYLPTGVDITNGFPIAPSPQGAAVAAPNGQRIGHIYTKAMFREFTDNSFVSQTDRPQWMGMIGPILRAEVGDTMKVTFKNMASNNHSMHPHGLLYSKANEGVSRPEQNFGGNSVLPGATWTYTWEVPERAGPGPLDPPSLAWTYHSDVAGMQDIYSGLVGASIVYRPGELAKHTLNVPAPKSSNLTGEVLTLFLTVDENLSFHIDGNTLNRTSITTAELQVNRLDPAFQQSNMKHSINGRLFSNLDGLNLTSGRDARWDVQSLGNIQNSHTPHWHGNTLMWAQQRVDIMSVLPAQTKSLSMTVDNPGMWIHHCQVGNHLAMGMIVQYMAQ